MLQSSLYRRSGSRNAKQIPPHHFACGDVKLELFIGTSKMFHMRRKLLNVRKLSQHLLVHFICITEWNESK